MEEEANFIGVLFGGGLFDEGWVAIGGLADAIDGPLGVEVFAPGFVEYVVNADFGADGGYEDVGGEELFFLGEGLVGAVGSACAVNKFYAPFAGGE